MFGLVARLLGGVITPLTDQIADASARLLRKLALFFVAGVCLVVVLIALTIAFGLWIAAKAGAIVAALSVAGVYLAVAVVAVVFALRTARPTTQAAADSPPEAAQAKAALDDQIDQFAAPLLRLLQKFGLRREQLAVLAGTSMAKQLGPLPLVGLAILAGFLVGRMIDSWRGLLSMDVISEAMGLFGLGGLDREDPPRDEAA